jgi:hypothetical protein
MRALISRSTFVAVLAAGLFAIGFRPAEASVRAAGEWHCENCRCVFPQNICTCAGPCTFW